MEQSLSPYNNCLLTALNLLKYVDNPFEDDASFNHDKFSQDVAAAVVFLNTASLYNRTKHPLDKQREEDEYGRRIGVETTGLADALAALGIRYGSEESIALCEEIAHQKAVTEIDTSLDLVPHFGVAPAFVEYLENGCLMSDFLDTPYMRSLNLPHSLVEKIKHSEGLANTAWNTIGPCGSISIMSDNCTSGIEPLFSFQYERSTRLTNKVYRVVHRTAIEPAKKLIEERNDGKAMSVELLEQELNYVPAYKLKPEDRLRMQAAWQKYTDASISSTVNLPEDSTIDDIVKIYTQAWELGLKGVTVFRDNCKKGVLSTGNVKEKKVATSSDEFTLYERELLDVETATRHRVVWKGSKVYVNVSIDENDNPVEVFAKLPRQAGYNGGNVYSEHVYQEKTSHWDTICRLISILLRVGMPVERIIQQLDKSCYSMTDAAGILSRVLRYHLPEVYASDEEIIEEGLGAVCPACGKNAYVYEGGCGICKACGDTSCG